MTDAQALIRSIAASAADLDGSLEPSGPRAGADRGDPVTAIRVLLDAPPVNVGIWQCTPGGWSITNRPDTETVHVLRGRARITDADGTTHDLGPGDAIVLPRGWSGRWDVLETVRKLYVTVEG